MRRRTLFLGASAASLMLATVSGAAMAVDPEESEEPTDTPEAPTEVHSGVVERATDAEGATVYRLSDGTSEIELSLGPPWFYDVHPLEEFVGQEVEIIGETDDGVPAPQADDRAAGDGQPSFDVYTVNGEQLRAPGRPPWAGGPAVVGERHPGYAGWSRGQEAANDAAP